MTDKNALPTAPEGAEVVPQVTSLDDWYNDFTTAEVVQLPTGRSIKVIHLDLVSEILAGTLPNFVLDHVIFGRDLLTEAEQENNSPQKIREYVEGLISIAARAVKEPKVRHPSDGPPRRELGEVPPSVFTLRDLQHIRFVALYDQLPSVKESPFRPGENESGESSEPGSYSFEVQDHAIGVPGNPEGQPEE